MTIEELNKLIKEELDAFFEADGEEGSDDIEVTTDEPEEGGEDDALDTLRQIYNMLKPMVEPEEEEEPEIDMEEPEAEEEGGEEEEEELDEAVDNHTFFKGDNVNRTTVKAKDVQGTREKASLKEGFDGATRFQKLAGLITESDIKKKLSLNENVAEKLIKVYKSEISSAKASDELDIIPALKKGITRLEKGEDPKKVNTATAKNVARIQGESDWDEFARIYMDKAKK
tara:strand:- start:1236 stop:1919 length:684 start_codon:yes stop_codon:yes gene_type:complete